MVLGLGESDWKSHHFEVQPDHCTRSKVSYPEILVASDSSGELAGILTSGVSTSSKLCDPQIKVSAATKKRSSKIS